MPTSDYGTSSRGEGGICVIYNEFVCQTETGVELMTLLPSRDQELERERLGSRRGKIEGLSKAIRDPYNSLDAQDIGTRSNRLGT